MIVASRHGHPDRSPALQSGLPWAGDPANSAELTCSAGPAEAINRGRSDFIHSETQKSSITPLSSTNMPQNPLRFFAIFVDFCAQIGTFRPQKASSATHPHRSLPPSSAGAANPASPAASRVVLLHQILLDQHAHQNGRRDRDYRSGNASERRAEQQSDEDRQSRQLDAASHDARNQPCVLDL